MNSPYVGFSSHGRSPGFHPWVSIFFVMVVHDDWMIWGITMTWEPPSIDSFDILDHYI